MCIAIETVSLVRDPEREELYAPVPECAQEQLHHDAQVRASVFVIVERLESLRANDAPHIPGRLARGGLGRRT